MGPCLVGDSLTLFTDPAPEARLVGIAKLAAQSEVLETKRVVRYFELGVEEPPVPDPARHAVRVEP